MEETVEILGVDFQYKKTLENEMWISKLTNKSISILGFAIKNIYFVGHILHGNGKTKSWDYIKSQYNLAS